MLKFKEWMKPSIILLATLLLTLFLPSKPIDPWNLFSPKKLASILFVLALLQATGSIIMKHLGSHMGSILHGFLGGLISSTATTVSLAQKSKIKSSSSSTSETLAYLAATLAMLFEAVALIFLGSSHIFYSLLLILIGPMLMAIFMIYFLSNHTKDHPMDDGKIQFRILPLFKLTIFILTILVLSKGLQSFFGQSGLQILTFVVSLFEIHGSIIANLQLADAGVFNVQQLGNLIAISIAATIVSKFFLISILGSPPLKKKVLKLTCYLALSLLLSWTLFLFQV